MNDCELKGYIAPNSDLSATLLKHEACNIATLCHDQHLLRFDLIDLIYRQHVL